MGLVAILAVVFGMGLVVKVAMHPIAVLVATLRLLFLFGVAMTVAYFTIPEARSASNPWPLFGLIAAGFGGWIATFVVPAWLRRRRW